ncbi:hypothetical protein CR919_09380 [Stenotrophomonas sp. LMG 10879]|uniref:hypothetical protein n=1 Tax=Stenotrophomonas sp. LMG 10879 TaxID=487706 RepID=UPI000C18FAFF|nr:hypothetical protein [Stenotrophomonas sp. LMG 10879]PII20067.1 hypothetical protein CR919_09380 [Stenotrophomonas sp. LMG 10879]
MIPEFNELPWSDATLVAVSVDRSNPGNHDEVVVHVRWPDGRNEQVTFVECRGARLALNFGVLGEDAIERAYIDEESEVLADCRQRWAASGVLLPELQCFRIETCTTGSSLDILAMGWRVGPQ